MESGLPQIACEASMPDMTVASMHPRFKSVSVQSPARKRLENPDFPGARRYLVVPGRLRQYSSVGSMLTRKNCVGKFGTAGLSSQLTSVASSNLEGSSGARNLGQISPQF